MSIQRDRELRQRNGTLGKFDTETGGVPQQGRRSTDRVRPDRQNRTWGSRWESRVAQELTKVPLPEWEQGVAVASFHQELSAGKGSFPSAASG